MNRISRDIVDAVAEILAYIYKVSAKLQRDGPSGGNGIFRFCIEYPPYHREQIIRFKGFLEKAIDILDLIHFRNIFRVAG